MYFIQGMTILKTSPAQLIAYCNNMKNALQISKFPLVLHKKHHSN